MKCNWCKSILCDGDEIICVETQKHYCSEECKEKDMKEYISFVKKLS